MLSTLVTAVRTARDELLLSAAAKDERQRDHENLNIVDPGVDATITEALDWICRAQDFSSSKDNGVARHYSLTSGWSPSYPETTGYIIPTMLHCAELHNAPQYAKRAEQMLDWLVSIQMENGAFQGGMINQTPVKPVTFNTGQILLGLAAGVRVFGDRYLPALEGAADWLVATQDADGAWRKFPSPFTEPGEKVYDVHVAWSLFEAARCRPGKGYAESAMRNIEWALSHQLENGWFASCDLDDPQQPLTHTIGYALRGIVEAYHYSQDKKLLEAARLTANGLLPALQSDGAIPGRLNKNWEGTVSWVCLTGNCQIAYCWWSLYAITGDVRYRDAARKSNAYVRRTIRLEGPLERRGGIKGSFPVSGKYGQYEYLNWAAKFCIDSNLIEQELEAPARKRPDPAEIIVQ